MATKRKKSKEKVFNDRKRKIFRKHIPFREVLFGIVFTVWVGVMALWFAGRKDKFDPGERDISIAVLIEQSVEDHLYQTPLKLWVDPALVRPGGPAVVDLGPFPSATVGGGWESNSRVQGFDASNLYEKINGQADQYIQFGFEYLHFISTKNVEENFEINIELYDMGSFANALGIFAAQRSAGSKVERLGRAFYYATEAGALGIAGPYYIKLTGSDNNAMIQEKALEILDGFQEEVDSASEAPRAMVLLSDGLDVAFQDIEYKPEDVFQYDFASDFWFGASPFHSQGRYYIHEAAATADAAALFEQILEEHLYDYTLVSREGNNALLKHEFLKTYFTLNQQDRFVFGIDGPATEDDAAAALNALREIIASEVGEAPAEEGTEVNEEV